MEFLDLSMNLMLCYDIKKMESQTALKAYWSVIKLSCKSLISN